jgi:hypothetical protein
VLSSVSPRHYRPTQNLGEGAVRRKIPDRGPCLRRRKTSRKPRAAMRGIQRWAFGLKRSAGPAKHRAWDLRGRHLAEAFRLRLYQNHFKRVLAQMALLVIGPSNAFESRGGASPRCPPNPGGRFAAQGPAQRPPLSGTSIPARTGKQTQGNPVIPFGWAGGGAERSSASPPRAGHG